MVDTVAARYLAQTDQLTAVLGGKIKDVAYVVHLAGTESRAETGGIGGVRGVWRDAGS